MLLNLRKTPFHPQWFVLRTSAYDEIDLVRPRQGERLLDIGCGRSVLERKLPSMVEYISLDYPDTGAELYHSSPSVFGTAEQLPFPDASIDIAVCLEVVEHLEDPKQAFVEIGRILKPGGRALVSVPFAYPIHDAPHDFQRLTEYQLNRFASDSKLVVTQIKETGHAIESAALLMNLAIAKTALEGIRRHQPAAFLVLCMPLIPFLNVGAWLLARLASDCGRKFLPTGYQLVLSKE
ncbi:MAG: class I SAM-dependent methyltransferase [Pseudomonadales bacterium]|nr:class I SAM-dependent methyltransferase [Pseudomonadales bacterium]